MRYSENILIDVEKKAFLVILVFGCLASCFEVTSSDVEELELLVTVVFPGLGLLPPCNIGSFSGLKKMDKIFFGARPISTF